MIIWPQHKRAFFCFTSSRTLESLTPKNGECLGIAQMEGGGSISAQMVLWDYILPISWGNFGYLWSSGRWLIGLQLGIGHFWQQAHCLLKYPPWFWSEINKIGLDCSLRHCLQKPLKRKMVVNCDLFFFSSCKVQIGQMYMCNQVYNQFNLYQPFPNLCFKITSITFHPNYFL